MVELPGGGVIMDREAEVVGIARHQRDIPFAANELASEDRGPGIGLELATPISAWPPSISR